jgi:hypothetical protein
MIKTQISKGMYVGMLLLDVQKAFDSISLEIIYKNCMLWVLTPPGFDLTLVNANNM